MNKATNSTFTISELTAGIACCKPEPHIEIRNLSIAYEQKIILDKVSLDIKRGCITAIIGPSGCGKTSFLSSLNRLCDMTNGISITGQIKLNGKDIRGQDSNVLFLRRQIGMIFQKPNPFPVSIYRNLELPLREHGVKDKQIVDSKIKASLDAVGLWHEVKDRLNSSALSLSGGQQQRLCIARAIILEPRVLLMDEPCSALDPISSGIVEELIIKLARQFTIVIVTHNLAQAKRIANYVAFFWIKEQVGQLIEFGRCQSFFTSPTDPLSVAYISGIKG